MPRSSPLSFRSLRRCDSCCCCALHQARNSRRRNALALELSEHVAKRLAAEAAVAKERRKAREDTVLAGDSGKKGGKKDEK